MAHEAEIKALRDTAEAEKPSFEEYDEQWVSCLKQRLALLIYTTD
jgi:hypothetical protein